MLLIETRDITLRCLLCTLVDQAHLFLVAVAKCE